MLYFCFLYDIWTFHFGFLSNLFGFLASNLKPFVSAQCKKKLFFGMIEDEVT